MSHHDLGLGRVPATDKRNLAHPMSRMLLGPLEPIPTRKTWAFRGDVLDQGATGTCTAHAAAHFLHAAPICHKSFIDPFALYREAVLLDEYPDNDADATAADNSGLQAGSSGTGVAKAMDKRGLLKQYIWAKTSREATEWVLTRGPVMVGTSWYEGMFNPTREGFVKIGPNDSVAGGHEYLYLGADSRQGIAHFVNSWGARWNHAATHVRAGHFLMSFEDLERLFHEDGDAVSAIEKAAAKTAK